MAETETDTSYNEMVEEGMLKVQQKKSTVSEKEPVVFLILI